MNVDLHLPAAQLTDFLLQLRSLAVRIAQAQIFVHFQVQLDEELPVLLHGGQVMHSEA